MEDAAAAFERDIMKFVHAAEALESLPPAADRDDEADAIVAAVVAADAVSEVTLGLAARVDRMVERLTASTSISVVRTPRRHCLRCPGTSRSKDTMLYVVSKKPRSGGSRIR